jgi:hypothetical protein
MSGSISGIAAPPVQTLNPSSGPKAPARAAAPAQSPTPAPAPAAAADTDGDRDHSGINVRA